MGSRVESWMLAGVQQQAWDEFRLTGDLGMAAEAVGMGRWTVTKWVREAGGIGPRRSRGDTGRVGAGVRLTYQDRVEIMVRLEHQESIRAIAGALGRAPSTISREVIRGRGPDGVYQARSAQKMTWEAIRRPQTLKLGVDTDQPKLRRWVVEELAAGWSPQQVTGRLAKLAACDPQYRGMSVHHETIYRALFLQARGGLKREVEAALKANLTSPDTADGADGGAVGQVSGSVLRSGRTARKPRTATPKKGPGRIPDIVPIGQRPPIRDDNGALLPGHTEGDLILGRSCKSAIGTLVERSTGYLWLLHLPLGHTAATVEDALVEEIARWPDVLRQTLTWDRGKELANHLRIAEKADIKIYFADPRSPWQRPGNENINGLLRQYFPKGTDLSVHSRADLDFVAAQLNSRPRARFGYATPDEMMTELLLH